MAQFKRFSGSESESYNSSYVGREGELTWDPDNGLRIHDGNQNGGQQIGITSYQSLNDLPTNLASIQSGNVTNNRQFLRSNSSTYEMEFANDFRVVPFADIDYPNGVVGDKVGDVAFDDGGIYYCGGEPNFIGTAILGDASGYVPGAWITLTSIPASGPVQVGQRLTDGTITSTVEEIVEGWPGYDGSRMIVRMTSDVSWHSGATGTVLSVISSGESVSTGNWVKFSKSYNDLTDKPTIPTSFSSLVNDTKTVSLDADGRTTFPNGTVPARSYGVTGDLEGMVVFTDDYIYYCKTSYSGSMTISNVSTQNTGSLGRFFNIPNAALSVVRVGWTVTGPNIVGTATITGITSAGSNEWEFQTNAGSVDLRGQSGYTLSGLPDIWVRTAWSSTNW